MYDEKTQELIRKEAQLLIKQCGSVSAARSHATLRAIKERSEFWGAVASFLSG